MGNTKLAGPNAAFLTSDVGLKKRKTEEDLDASGSTNNFIVGCHIIFLF